MTVPLALRLPKICEGFPLLTILKTTDPDEGCKNVVVSPAAMSKLLKFKTVNWPTVTFNCEPNCCAVALPSETVMPEGLAKDLEALQIKTSFSTIRIILRFDFALFMSF